MKNTVLPALRILVDLGMYFYRLQHRILEILNIEIVRTKMQYATVEVLEIIKKLPTFKRANVIKAVTALSLQGYCRHELDSDGRQVAGLTDKGLKAFATQEFLILQGQIRSSLIRDIAGILINLIIAATPIYVIYQSKNESRQTTDRIQKIQAELQKANKEIELLKSESKKRISYSNDTLPSAGSTKTE